MSKPAWENLGVFFQSDRKGGFAKAAFFFKADGTPVNDATDPVYVIYDDPKYDANAGEYNYETSEPRITFAENIALAGLRKKDRVRIQDEGEFILEEHPRPDGTGTVSISLAPADAYL